MGEKRFFEFFWSVRLYNHNFGWYYNDTNRRSYGFRGIGQKGWDDMDYRKEIKKLIYKVHDQEKLRIIYRFIRKYIED